MIRQDYFMRMVQRLTQALAQALFHKGKLEYDRAEQELNAALAECFRLGNTLPDLEELIDACATEGGADGVVRLADVFAERGEIQRLTGNSTATQNDALALGLYLQVLQTSVVSLELIEKTEQLIARTAGTRLPASVLKRLLTYFEARGMFARAEDTLYDWLETNDSTAHEAGLAFYHRLAKRPDDDLAQGGLARAEIEQGFLDWQNKIRQV